MKKLIFLAAIVVVAMFAQNADAATRLNLCTGKTSGNYYKAGIQVASQAKGYVDVNPVETAGSMENLVKLADGSCDAAIVQSDAYMVYKKQNPKAELDLERAASLYNEYAHLICNRASGVTSISKLTNKTPVAIGPMGAGSQVTWDGFVMADPKTFKDIPTIPLDGIRALKKVSEGSDVTCMLYVAGLKTQFMLDDASREGSKLVLAKADNENMDRVLDQKKKPVYAYMSIPSETYPSLQDGFFSSAVKTVATTAILVVNSKWIDNNDKGYEVFLKAESRAEAAIRKLVTPDN